ncbi:MAG: ABC transporter transmembrane domain-containing protein, partial [Alphaproteobacteria bacterium]
MERSIFQYILRYSTPQQLALGAAVLVSYPFLYLSLDLPKIIVNQAINGGPQGPYKLPLFGTSFKLDVAQLQYLFLLCGIYLLLVLINGAFKYYINVYKGQLGERLLRRLRYQLFEAILRFPLPRFRKVSQGELIPMITAEVEPLGGFIGTAFVDPLFFGGQLLIILAFIMVQDPFLGAAAIAMYPFQMYVIPKLQRKVNQLGKTRVREVRRLSDQIGESVAGVVEVRAHDTVRYELARFADRLGRIYFIRFEIYRRKFFIKFLNNFIDKLTPFFFFAIGGYLVIHGDLSFGALLAVLAAYKDLAAPWKELLAWYQQKEDIRIKYEQVVEQFEPPAMLPEAMLHGEPEASAPQGELTVQNVALHDEDGAALLDNVTLHLPLDRHLAVIGDDASGKSELAMVIARLLLPSRGRVLLGGADLAEAPLAVTGRRIGYVAAGAYLMNASIGDNLVYGLKHKPVREIVYEGEALADWRRRQDEAMRAGNLPFDIAADWIDLEAAGVSDAPALDARLVEVLRLVELDGDVYQLGLRGTVDPTRHPEVASRVLEARFALHRRLQDKALRPLVETFDRHRFNNNATVAENLLFGAPVDERFDVENLAEHPYVQGVLDRIGLTEDFVRMGRQVAETMVELFADLPPEHEFFQQYSFISAEALPEYQVIAERARRDPAGIAPADRQRLLALPFKLIPARHRLGLIDTAMEGRILEARAAFAAELPADLQGAIAFFDERAYNPAASLQDNILFGKLAHGHAHAATKIGSVIQELVNTLGIRDTIIRIGLNAPAGIGGGRLSTVQRQKVALARCILKRPEAMIVNAATDALDAATQNRVIERVLAEREGRTTVWVLNRPEAASLFDETLVMKNGQVAEQGPYDRLRAQSGALAAM